MRLGPEITVDIAPEFFTFSYKSHSIKVNTTVTVTADDKKKVISVGENRLEPGQLTIGLFNADQVIPQDFNKVDLLTAFIAFGMGRVLEGAKLLFFRPILVFHGIEQLERILCGYHMPLLKAAAFGGGARGIRFD